MAFIRSFENYKPPSRYDGVPFITARIQESAVKDTGYLTIKTVTIAPADSDPSTPAERDFTTNEAQLEAGWYRIQWVDVNDSIFNSEATFFPAYLRPAVLATPEDVGRMLRSPVPAESEDDVVRALEVAESWVRRYLKQPNLGFGDTATVSFSDVNDGGYILVNGDVQSVSVVDWAGAQPRLLSSSQWTADETGIRLRTYEGAWYDPRYSDTRLPARHVRVDIVTLQSAEIDPRIRDAVALAAGALWTRGPRVVKGLASESVGDYHYTTSSWHVHDSFFAQAESLLVGLVTTGVSVT